MQTEFKVLDHGFVKYVMSMGTEESIIEAARQSTQKGFLGWNDGLDILSTSRCACEPDKPATLGFHRKENKDCPVNKPGDEKLLEYLYKNRHTTPFEMCELVVQVKAPIMVLRQWHRHRTFSYNEWSGRYSQLQDEFYLPEPRLQDPSKNKQGSLAGTYASPDGTKWTEIWADEQTDIYSNYDLAVDQGIVKEVARINMPVSVYTIMWAKANLHNWLHFLKLRMDSHAQYEIRVYANAVAEIVRSLWPRTYALFEEYSLHSVTLSRNEAETVRRVMKEFRIYHGSHYPNHPAAAEELRIEERLEDNIK